MRKHTVMLCMALCALGMVTCVLWGERDAERDMRRRAETRLVQVQGEVQAAQQTRKDAEEALLVGKAVWNEALASVTQERDRLMTENLTLSQQTAAMRLAADEAGREAQGKMRAASSDEAQGLAQALAQTQQQAAALAAQVKDALASVTDLTAENERLSRRAEAAEQALAQARRPTGRTREQSICRGCDDPLLCMQIQSALEAFHTGCCDRLTGGQRAD